jgi:hypothetical protein
LLCIVDFRLLLLDTNLDNLQELEDQDFEQLAGDPGKSSLTMLDLYSFSLQFTYLTTCIGLTTYTWNTFRIWVYDWVDLLSLTVLSYHTSLPSFMMLSLTCGLVLRVLVFHPSRCELNVVEDRCCGFSKVWLGGDG